MQIAKRTWDTNFLSTLGQVYEGKAIRFELLNGEMAVGEILRQQSREGQLTYISGQLTQPVPGRFFLEKQSMPGVAGPFAGVIELPSLGIAYRVEPSASNQGAELVQRPLRSVLCMDLPQPGKRGGKKVGDVPPLNPGLFPTEPIPEYQNGVIVLESLHGATSVIYLDFQGGYTESWGGIAYERSNYGNAEIVEIWRRMAEDYMPFNINVTTDLKAFENAGRNSRQRVIVTPTDTAQPEAGGAAYVGSFNLTVDTPCWVFVTQAAKYAAEACAHEAGHGLGLIHDGQEINGVHHEYFYGQGGSVDTGWAPIMGVAYYDNVTQWSKGEYLYANNLEDQLLIIANQNNVRFRTDDTGDTLATSRYLEIYADGTASAEGVIETTEDTDAFQFTTTGGAVFLQANPVDVGPNLAVQVSLYDANDTLLASNNPQDTLWASLSANLPGGTYTFRVTGAGRKNPLIDGFSSYASLGYYSITGQVANARLPNRFAIPEHAPDGTIVGIVPPWGPAADTFSYSIRSGNRGNTFAIDNSGTLIVADNGLLDYDTLITNNSHAPVQFELLVNIEDDSQASFNETNRRVLVTITNLNAPPVITGFVSSNALPEPGFFGLYFNLIPGTPLQGLGILEDSFGAIPQFSAAVLEHAAAGTAIGAILGTDPDLYTVLSYSIIGGNSNSMFAIDNGSGIITVAGDPAAEIQSQYALTVVVSDQTPPVPLMVTSIVNVAVELPYKRGGIACAAYTNINGGAVSNLTSSPSFPLDPAFEFEVPTAEAAAIEGASIGAVMRGYLLPPATGTYTFWIASVNDSELWLGTSASPASAQRIASITGATNLSAPGLWTNHPSQQSSPVWLAAGYAYYLEARVKAGTSSNYLGVAWACPSNGIPQQMVPGDYLSPFHMNYVPHPIAFNGILPRNAIAGYQVGTVSVSDVNSQDTETLALLSSDVPGAFSLDPVSGAMRLVDEDVLADTNRTQCTLLVQATDNGVPPLSGTNTITINLVAANTLLADGIAAEVWTNIPGTSLTNLTNDSNFPQRPDIVRSLPALILSDGFGVLSSGGVFTNLGAPFGISLSTDPGLAWLLPVSPVQNSVSMASPLTTEFGARIRGYLTPTNTGPFTFFISSADESVLRFSTTMNPSDAQPIASMVGGQSSPWEWTKYPWQQSAPLWLYSSNRYYFEVLLKTGGGPGPSWPITGLYMAYGHVEVGWAGPGLTGTNVIDGAFLSPVDLEYPPVFTNFSIALPITAENGMVVTTLAAQASAADTLAYKILSGNTSNTFALNPYTGELSVSDNSSFASYAVSNFTLLVEAQDAGYGGLYPLKSALATIRVSVVDNSPAVVWSGDANAGVWSLADNWGGVLPNEHSKLIFQGTNQLTNHNDFLRGAALVKINANGFYIDGDPMVLQDGLQSLGTNTWAIDSTLGSPAPVSVGSGALTIRGALKNSGYPLNVQVTSAMFIEGEISGAGGLSKLGGGRLVISGINRYTGPTDIKFGSVLVTNFGSLATSAALNVGVTGTLNVQGSSGIYTIPPSQTLTGNGTVIGPVFIQGTLAPALPAAGQYLLWAMHFSNNLALAGQTTLIIGAGDGGPSGSLNQTIRVDGEVQYGGVLTVVTNSDIRSTFPQTFRLFDASNYVGSFSAFNLPARYKWDTSTLITTGTIRAVGFAAPPVLPLTYSNGMVYVRLQSTVGTRYALESTGSLQPPVHWVQGAFQYGSGKVISFPFPVLKNAPQRYFRIKIY
ncbi:MAG TPA: cadherin domain-containing protein [Verrucomicrobiae bacterium]|nr:cadherin domain-containing protein [Verrucomicrobiae bacterium]